VARVKRMAAIRDSHGRIMTPPEYASAEFRAHALVLQRAGSSIRSIAAETGRSKTALARDLALARKEESTENTRARAERAAAAVQRESRPGAYVWLGEPGYGLRRVRGGSVLAAIPLPHVREYTPAREVVRAEREYDRLMLAACRRAGLSDTGFATFATSISRGSYDPDDPADVERVRLIIQDEDGDEAAHAWMPHSGLRGLR
jgi:hypothetical protein